MPKLSMEIYVERFRLVHGDLYDYSSIEIVDKRSYVDAICKIHGMFNQLVTNHLNGSGCPHCRNEKLSLRFRSSKEEFVSKAIEVHSGKYDYSLFSYVNAHVKGTIICSEHGAFQQNANNHLNGKGCEECGIRYRAENRLDRVTPEEFIRRATEIHGNKFQYRLEEYEKYDSKIGMICPKQHEFRQSPEVHVGQQSGCPFCKESKGESLIQELLLKHNINFIREYILPETKYTFRYDFYLPSYNLLIEFHGGQHYFPVDFFGGEEAFKATCRRDILKKALAKETGRKIVYFNYKDLKLPKEQFEKLLMTYINKVISSRLVSERKFK